MGQREAYTGGNAGIEYAQAVWRARRHARSPARVSGQRGNPAEREGRGEKQVERRVRKARWYRWCGAVVQERKGEAGESVTGSRRKAVNVKVKPPR